MKENIIQAKSFDFALKILLLCKNSRYNSFDFVLFKQLLRCGTSIGANVEEALGGQSKNDFLAKLSIAYKEGREANYWLRLLHESKILADNDFIQLVGDCNELLRIIGRIQITTKSRN